MRRRPRHRRRSGTRLADRNRGSGPCGGLYWRITATNCAGMLLPVAPDGVKEMKSPSCTSLDTPAADGTSLAPEPAMPTGMLGEPMLEPPLIATAIAAGAIVIVPSSTA